MLPEGLKSRWINEDWYSPGLSKLGIHKTTWNITSYTSLHTLYDESNSESHSTFRTLVPCREHWPVDRVYMPHGHNRLPCRFCNGRVIMPPAAAAATSPWMLVRFAVGSVRTSPCCPPSCLAMLKGMRIGWLRAGVPPGITPATAEANCCAVRSGCKETDDSAHFPMEPRHGLLEHFSSTYSGSESSWTSSKETCSTLEKKKKLDWLKKMKLHFIYYFWKILFGLNILWGAQIPSKVIPYIYLLFFQWRIWSYPYIFETLC